MTQGAEAPLSALAWKGEPAGLNGRIRRNSPSPASRLSAQQAERLAKLAAPNSDWWKTAEGIARMRAARP